MTLIEGTSTTERNGPLTALFWIGFVGILGGFIAMVIGFGGGTDFMTGELNNGIAIVIGAGLLGLGVLALLLALTAAAIVWRPDAPEKEWRAAPKGD